MAGLGTLLCGTNRRGLGIEYLERVLVLDPSRLMARHNLAVAYAKKKWYADALGEARKAFELFPTDDNRKVLELIQAKESQKTVSEPMPKDTSR